MENKKKTKQSKNKNPSALQQSNWNVHWGQWLSEKLKLN